MHIHSFTDLHMRVIDRFVSVSGFGNGATIEALSETEVRIGPWRIQVLDSELEARPYRGLYDIPGAYRGSSTALDVAREITLPDVLVALATQEQAWRLDALMEGTQKQIARLHRGELMEPEYRRLSRELGM